MARELNLNDIAGPFLILAIGIFCAIVVVAFNRLFLWITLCRRRRGAPHLELFKLYKATIARIVPEGVYIHIEFQTRDFFLPHAALNPNNTPPLTAEQLNMGIGESISVKYFGKDTRGRKVFKVVGWNKISSILEENDEDAADEEDTESDDEK